MTQFDFTKNLPETITSARLILRKPDVADVCALVRLGNSARIHEMVSVVPHPFTKADATALVTEKARTQTDHQFTILTRDEDVVGIIALHDHDIGIETGYWLGEPYWGHGYASEALGTLMNASDKAGCATIVARAMVKNPASAKVLVKAGFTKTKTYTADCGTHANVPMDLFQRSSGS